MYLDILVNKLLERVNQPQVNVVIVKRGKHGEVTHKKTIPIAYVVGHANLQEGINITIESSQIEGTDWSVF